MTSRRPKIIKLHGDFLYDNIKNTVRELESLEINMREKFKQYATEFGLIVLGYAGNDRSVMDTIEALLKSDENFPSGIYWCVRKQSAVHPNVRGLARFPKFKLIEVEGFDEFCAQVHERLELELQPEMRDPYGVLATRLNALIEAVNLPKDSPAHPVIGRDIENLGRQVAKNLEGQVARIIDPDTEKSMPISTRSEVVEVPIPFEFLAEAERRKGHFGKAFPLIMRQLAIRPHARAFVVAFHILSESGWEREPTDVLVKLLLESAPIVQKRPEMTFDISLMLMSAGKWDHAAAVVEFGAECYRSDVLGIAFEMDYYLINKAQIPLHQGESLNEPTIEEMKRITIEGNIVSKMGASIILGDYETAEDILRNLVEDASQGWPSKKQVWTWPVVALLKPHMKDTALMERLDAGATKLDWVEYGIIGF